MDNPEKPATLGTQDIRRRQTKQRTQNTVLDSTMLKQTQMIISNLAVLIIT